MRNTQMPLFTPDTEWVMPEELKDLKGCKEMLSRNCINAIEVEVVFSNVYNKINNISTL